MGLGQGARRDHLTSSGGYVLAAAPDVFDGYERIRHRLPKVRAPDPDGPRHAGSLAEIADGFDVFLLDAFGVLNIGETAIPGVVDRMSGLRRAGKTLRVVTNAASVPKPALVRKYRQLGYDFAADEVISSRQTLLKAIPRDDGCSWGVMMPRAGDQSDLEGLDLTLLSDSRAAYDAVDAFLLLGSSEWSETRQRLLEEALAARPRPVQVANPDMAAPREDGLTLEPGHFAHRLADRTGVAPVFYGKPFGNIYDLVFGQLPAPPDQARVLMVGDSLHTDVLGAMTAGVKSALISDWGFFDGHDHCAAIESSGIAPDFILPRP